MGLVATVPWDGTNYGKGWQGLAVAYFAAAGNRVKAKDYSPHAHGVPADFNAACKSKDQHFTEAVFAWFRNQDAFTADPPTLAEAPWVVEWAAENYLGRYESRHQFAEFELANELPHSDWDIPWEECVDFSKVFGHVEDRVVCIRDEGYLYVFDQRYTTPQDIREQWLADQVQPLEVGEQVEVFAYTPNQFRSGGYAAVVRGKWQVGPGYEWMVAVELTEAVGPDSGQPGDVLVREDNQTFRGRAQGITPRRVTQAEIGPLPVVTLAHRRVVNEEGTNDVD